MKRRRASVTAKLIAASALLLSSKPRWRYLVPSEAAEWSQRFLSHSRADRWLAWSATQPLTRAVWLCVERLTHPGITTHYWRRKRWIETRCREAISEGFERILILGAGFDTLGCRIAREFPRLDVVEVDHPATQDIKRRTFDDAGLAKPALLTFIPVDLSVGFLPEALTMSQKFTFVIIEGVMMYLLPSAVDKLLNSLTQMSAARMRIIFSFMTQWPDGSSGFRPRSWLIERWLSRQDESFKWSMPPDRLETFLLDRNLRLIESVSTRQLIELSSINAPPLEGENLVLCEPIRNPM